MIYSVDVAGRRVRVEVEPGGAILIEHRDAACDAREIDSRTRSLVIDGRSHEVTVLSIEPLRLLVDGREIAVRVTDERALAAGGGTARGPAGRIEIRAPMPGLLKALHVNTGDVVESDGAVCTLEAMKMENELRSPARARVERLPLAAGTKVEGGAVLAILLRQE